MPKERYGESLQWIDHPTFQLRGGYSTTGLMAQFFGQSVLAKGQSVLAKVSIACSYKLSIFVLMFFD